MSDRKNELILLAKSLQIDMLRVAPMTLAPKHQDTFERWVGEGCHGEMNYLAGRLASGRHAGTVTSEPRSVITIGVNYYHEPRRQPASDEGAVSRYAVMRDYHKVITGKLKTIARMIETQWGGAARYYVDTGPVLERAFAESAGIGYVGRNTCVISETHGSWIFLAVIITDIELAPDENTTTLRCGTCRRCIDACPTAAIREDYTVDARLCISYLTIEHRGPIPVELRPLMGNWLFGCDICQDVCPHNGRALPTRVEDFKKIRIGDAVLSLRELLAIADDTQFLERFAGLPLTRTKRRGLLRNACVVAGNSGDVSLVEPLRELIERETDDLLQEHAQWAIDQLTTRSCQC